MSFCRSFVIDEISSLLPPIKDNKYRWLPSQKKFSCSNFVIFNEEFLIGCISHGLDVRKAKAKTKRKKIKKLMWISSLNGPIFSPFFRETQSFPLCCSFFSSKSSESTDHNKCGDLYISSNGSLFPHVFLSF